MELQIARNYRNQKQKQTNANASCQSLSLGYGCGCAYDYHEAGTSAEDNGTMNPKYTDTGAMAKDTGRCG
jgi:hypothetical protein